MEYSRWLAVLPLILVSACGGGSGAAPDDPSANAPVGNAPPVTTASMVKEGTGAAAPADGEGPAAPLARPDEHPGPEPADVPGDAGAIDRGEFVLAGYDESHLRDMAAPDIAAPMMTHAAAPGMGEAGPTAMHAAPVARRTLYVSPNGSDNNPGTADKPFRSLGAAGRAVTAGTRVMVAPGMYSGGFRTNVSGQATARISFISSQRWGAKIVPAANSPNRFGWNNRGSYVDIVGFEIDGSKHTSGVRWTHGIYNGGSYDVIRNNRVHHIAQDIACNSGGGAAIGVDSYYHGVKSDVTANLVHDIGPKGCRFVQGIYVSTSGRVRNNVVYRVAAAGIHLWHDARDVVITNNTVTASSTGIIIGGGDFYHATGPNDNTAVYSNIVVGNKVGISEQGRTGLNNTYRNNLVYRNEKHNWRLKNNLRHTGTVSAEPRFVVESSAYPSLKLTSSSPAIGRAAPELAASTDFEGRPRNAAAGYDIGAFQY